MECWDKFATDDGTNLNLVHIHHDGKLENTGSLDWGEDNKARSCHL